MKIKAKDSNANQSFSQNACDPKVPLDWGSLENKLSLSKIPQGALMSNQQSARSFTLSISPFRATMRKENFCGLLAIVLLFLAALHPMAEAFRFAAEESVSDTVVAAPLETEEKAAEPAAPVAFGAKEAESAAIGLHPATYTKDPSSSREDRALGKDTDW